MMALRLLRMAQDGYRIAEDARRMFEGLHRDVPRIAPGFLRMAQDGTRIT